jgi:Alginate export
MHLEPINLKNMRTYTLFLAFLILSSTLSAQEFDFSAKFRERTEVSGKSFSAGESADAFHLLRTQFRADIFINMDVSMVFEIQDSRQWGSEPSTFNLGDRSAKSLAFDVPNAYIEIQNLASSGVAVILGRQLRTYGYGRFIGSREWSQFRQSFDGIAASTKLGNTAIDAFGYALKRHENIEAGSTNAYQYTRDEFLTGLWITNKDIPNEEIQFFWFYDNPVVVSLPGQTGTASPLTRLRRHTAGLHSRYSAGIFSMDIEGALQFGKFYPPAAEESVETPLEAYFYALNLGVTIPGAEDVKFQLGYEVQSGADSDPGTVEAFATQYGFWHKHHGFMDRFSGPYAANSSIKNHGLKDSFVKLSYLPLKGLGIHAAFHVFNEEVGPEDYMASTENPFSSALAMEIDLWSSMKVSKVVDLRYGVSIFEMDKDRASYYNLRKTTKWGWMMVVVAV